MTRPDSHFVRSHCRVDRHERSIATQVTRSENAIAHFADLTGCCLAWMNSGPLGLLRRREFMLARGSETAIGDAPQVSVGLARGNSNLHHKAAAFVQPSN